jgi:hypothetical protein
LRADLRLAVRLVDLTFEFSLDPKPNLSTFEIADCLALRRPIGCRFDRALAVPSLQSLGVDLDRLI